MVEINPNITETDYFEKMLLSKAINHPEERRKLRLDAEHLFDDRHSAIYSKISNDIGFSKEDLLTESVRHPHKYGDYNFIRSISEFPISSQYGIVNDQGQVYEFYKKRETQKVMDEYKNDPSDEMAMAVSNRIMQLNKFNVLGNDRKLNVLSEIRDDLFNENTTAVYKTGFPKLDEIIDGFETQQLNVIAARSSMGKTAFALQVANNLQNERTEVVFCSIESTEKNMTQRLLSSLSRVDLRKFKDPVNRMTKDDVDKVLEAIDYYYNTDFRIEEKARFTPNMVRRIANNISEDKQGFIIIDYLQLMDSDNKYNSPYEKVSDVSRELKIITQEFPNITIIPLAQVNRGTESRQEKRPMMSDLKDSGQTEQDSSMIMMLYRDDYYNPPGDVDPKAPSPLEVIVVKNKDGGLGTATLDFYKQIQKIY